MGAVLRGGGHRQGAGRSARLIEATKRAEAEQVEEAVGDASPEAIFAFSDAYLGSMVHDVNVVHGLLEPLREPLPARVVDAAWWSGGTCITADSWSLCDLRPLPG